MPAPRKTAAARRCRRAPFSSSRSSVLVRLTASMQVLGSLEFFVF